MFSPFVVRAMEFSIPHDQALVTEEDGLDTLVTWRWEHPLRCFLMDWISHHKSSIPLSRPIIEVTETSVIKRLKWIMSLMWKMRANIGTKLPPNEPTVKISLYSILRCLHIRRTCVLYTELHSGLFAILSDQKMLSQHVPFSGFCPDCLLHDTHRMSTTTL